MFSPQDAAADDEDEDDNDDVDLSMVSVVGGATGTQRVTEDREWSNPVSTLLSFTHRSPVTEGCVFVSS